MKDQCNNDLLVDIERNKWVLKQSVLILLSLKVGWDCRALALSPHCRLLIGFVDVHTADEPGTKWKTCSEAEVICTCDICFLYINQSVNARVGFNLRYPNVCSVHFIYKTYVYLCAEIWEPAYYWGLASSRLSLWFTLYSKHLAPWLT